MKIFIDGDACPVIKNTIKIAKSFGIDVIIVKNHNHVIKSDYAKIIDVDASRDSADFYIVNNITKNDIVITQDYGLAAMVLTRESYVITPNGKQINDNNLSFHLNSRYATQLLKHRNKRPKSKLSKRSTSDNILFENNLIYLITKVKVNLVKDKV